MAKTDLVLLHAPSVYDFRERSIMFGPVSDMVPSTPVFEMYPLGFTTMAEYMERHGLRVRIVNLAVLMLNRPGFDVDAAIRDMDPAAFGIDLHWLPHAHGSVEIAKLCKKHHPDTPVVFGGLSASFFHEELIGYPCVDYVVRGDSTELPMTLLMYAIKGKGRLDDVPNLTYKTAEGSVVVNELSWVPDTMNDISLDYSYSMRAVIRDRDMMSNVPFKDWLQYPVCASLTCRGCTHDCATCGGSAHAFRTHYGRRKVAFRDPELLVRDIANIQRYIPGPVFVLNDFLQAGRDYVAAFIKGVGKLNLRNPIAFEFFKPPKADFYEFLNEHLTDYSVEISVESHDDAVRRAFGKHHYTMADVEESIALALAGGCSRFDLYYMTGLPSQTAASVLETADYAASLYEKVRNDKRLLQFTSPMAPFLDPGSLVYDDPAAYGYRRLADTLEEHRQLLLEPSWKQIMNYESLSMSKDEMVDATYEAAIGLNRVKASIGHLDEEHARRTEERIVAARETMGRIDRIMAGDPTARDAGLAAVKSEVERLNESTVCEKSDLNWPAYLRPVTILNVAGLWLRENVGLLFRRPKRVPPIGPGRSSRVCYPGGGPTAGRARRRRLVTDGPPASPGRPAAGEAASERVQGIFGRIAGRYDILNVVLSLGMDRSWRRRAVRAAGLTPESAALDLCAGTGDLTLALAELGRPASVTGTDFVPEMLEVAERKLARYDGPAKVTFSLADAQALPFADESFDVVTVAFGVRNLPDRAANFREVLRVLKPGGRYVVLEFSTPPNRAFRAVCRLYNRTVVPFVGGLVSGDRASYQYLNESILRFPDQQRLAAELRDAGFTDAGWQDLTGGVVAIHRAVK